MNLIRLAFFALTLLTAGNANAQNYPDRAIRIIVGFTAGSATDISARMFAQKLSDAWAVPDTVESALPPKLSRSGWLVMNLIVPPAELAP